MLTFLSRLFDHARKCPGKIAKANFKMYDVTGWRANNYNKHIAQYFEKKFFQKP